MLTERPVEFASYGATLRGRLYLPSGSPGPRPVVVMAHGYSATIDGMVADKYADTFRDAGLAVLLYDHRGFGRSDGKPRQRIDRWMQVIEYRDAIDFISTLDDVDASRIAIWGDSLSGGCVIVAGRFDPRVRAIVTQVPACGRTPPPADLNGAIVERMSEVFDRRDVPVEPAVEGPLPVVSTDQLGHPSALTPLTAFRWFIEYGGRYGTSWHNWVTIVAADDTHPYHPVLCAARLRVPVLFVIATDDEMPGANSAVARLAFERARGPKELLEIGGGHFGLLCHPSELFDVVSRAERDFLVRWLR